MDVQHTLTGDIQAHPQFASRILRNSRDVLVYLPRGYRRSIRRRYRCCICRMARTCSTPRPRLLAWNGTRMNRRNA